jgi:hypothetical protein
MKQALLQREHVISAVPSRASELQATFRLPDLAVV